MFETFVNSNKLKMVKKNYARVRKHYIYFDPYKLLSALVSEYQAGVSIAPGQRFSNLKDFWLKELVFGVVRANTNHVKLGIGA